MLKFLLSAVTGAGSMRLRWGRPSLSALPLLLLAAVAASPGPSSAQAPADVVTRLRSLPPQMQRNALRRYLYFYEPRAYPNQQIPAGALERARRDHERKFGALRPLPPPGAPAFAQGQWTAMGPDHISTTPTTSGRINSIAIQPNDPNVIYVAAATGGVWKTTNGGASWTPLTDTRCSLAMGSIVIDPSNYQTIYAGTGEENFSGDSYYGCGVLKSTDGGATWTQLGANVFDTATGGARIGKIAIHPTSTGTLLVASDFGLYRSTNGGASFAQVLAGIATDVVFDPVSPSNVYAALGRVTSDAANGVYKSTNSGANWVKLGGGLPTANVGRISLALAPPPAVQAIVACPDRPGFQAGGVAAANLLIGGGQPVSGYGWTSSALPSGVVLDGATGVVRGDGNPANVPPAGSVIDIPVTVTDNNGQTIQAPAGTVQLQVQNYPPGSTTPCGLPVFQVLYGPIPLPATPGVPYGVTLSVVGGRPPYNWTLASGSLPTGLVLDAATGVVRGTASAAQAGQVFNFTVTVTDSLGAAALVQGPYSLGVCGGGIACQNQSLQFLPRGSPTVYASVHNVSTGGLLGIWRSTDEGATWSQRSGTGASCSTQCWYDMTIAVDPTNADIVYFGGLSLHRSTNGAGSFTDIGSTIHVDHHALAFLPTIATTIFSGNDGGLFKSTNSGSTWTSLNSNLAITQFYSGFSLHPSNAGIAMGGTQDNGTMRTTGSAFWDPLIGGDGGFTAIDFSTPATAYGETQWSPNSGYSGPRRSDNVGTSSFALKTSGINLADNALFIPPLVMSPSNSQTLYFGTTKVYKTTNRGDTWTASGTTLGGSVTAIAQAPTDANVIYAAAANAVVYKSTNGNASYTAINSGLPSRAPTYLAVHPSDANTAFVTFSGFGTGHVYKTTNGGTSWTNISGDLPDVPVNAILLDPGAPTTEILVGTDLGVYRTSNGGTTWTPFSTGLPNVPVLDLKYNAATGLLVAATHGRGAWKVPVGSLTRDCRALAATHDFNGDGRSDIAWRQSPGGTTAAWLMNGAQVTQSGSFGVVPTSWQIVGQRDFNGDGKCDWLWRDGPSGTVAIWLLNGLLVAQSGSLGTVPGNWAVAGTSDFNGDGKGDILWRDANTGTVAIWLLNGLQVSGSGSLGTVPAEWTLLGADGRGHILWRHATTGTLAIWVVNGLQVTQSASLGAVPPNWQVAGAGDFNGDGNTDILWRDSATGTVAIWLMNGVQVTQTGSLGAVPANWSIALTGDFNGDGRSDILWRETGSGAAAIWFLNGLQVSSSAGLGTVGLDWTIQAINAE